MLIGVPKEIKTEEYRVGLTPGAVGELVQRGHSVIVETNAAHTIGIDDADFEAAGAVIVGAAKEVFARADMIVKVKEPQASEFDLLRVFVERAGRLQNRDQLRNSTTGRDRSPSDRSIDNLISRLRRKIEADPAKPQLIKTVRGAGYVFTPKVTRH